MTLKKDPNFEGKMTFCLKNDMTNLVNCNASSGKSENLHFDVLLLYISYVMFELKNTEELYHEE